MYPNLKLQLWRQGIRQARLAQLLGMHESVLSRIVNGFRIPDGKTRLRIAELLGSDEKWLFERDGGARDHVDICETAHEEKRAPV